jgi:hypothetical protein
MKRYSESIGRVKNAVSNAGALLHNHLLCSI